MDEVASQNERSGINVIEFDGNTVLCRVCGDRASGFHYGVHACEGCKGFFRRSIQQKIQYRPCVKNQHCLITRVNRNRCQYCRLKKCIAIGMSRDAVRFGRVPKREKAKIMEQMQKVNLQCFNSCAVEVADEVEMKRRIIEAYDHTCQFSARKAAIFKEKARRRGRFVCCPSKMACPLNPTPEAEYSSIDRWSMYSNGFMPAIHNVVTFARLIPGFTNLNHDDQIMLLKIGTFEILLLQLSCLFDLKSNMMFFTNENIFLRKLQSPTSGAGYLLGSVFDFSDRLTNLNLTDSEMALFSAYILFSPDRPGLHNICLIERLQSLTSQLLKRETDSNHPNHPDLFEKLLTKIPEMRLLNTIHSEKLLGLDVPSTIAHSSPLQYPRVPEDMDQPNLFWTNQQRGLFQQSPHYMTFNPTSDWPKSPQTSATNDDTSLRLKRKFGEGKEVGFELSRRLLKSEVSSKELAVNCHRVSPYSPPEVVLSTSLGTFHRMPLTPWSTDQHKSLASTEVQHKINKCNRSDMKLFDQSPSFEKDLPSNHFHPKKKVARVWSRDSFSQAPSRTFENDSKHSSEDSDGRQECDSTDWAENPKPSTGIRGEPLNKDRKKFFSDFNINSRFLSHKPPSPCTQQSEGANIQSTATTSLNQAAFTFPKYTKIPFPMALWSNSSALSAPFFLPPSFSASDAHSGSFKTSLSLLDHLVKRDNRNLLGVGSPLTSGRVSKDDSNKSDIHSSSNL